MTPLLKHLTVRLWLSALSGGMVCLLVLPWWQRFFGLDWLVLPAAVALTACFMMIGWALNRLGIRFVRRHINEAAVWERAGMMREAESALQRGVAYFDSFWLSPLLRRERTAWIMAVMARFYLGQTARNPHARRILALYLRRHPQDSMVAEGWLEQLLNREHHSVDEYEAAARIGEALEAHDRIQQLLMQFHLANGRSDFDAIQNYQYVWQRQQPLPGDLVRSLTRLLLNERVLSHWALKVYLSAYQGGDQTALEGIAAAVRWLRPTVENNEDLAAARKLVADIQPERIERLAGRFRPARPDPSARDHTRRPPTFSTARGRALTRGLAASGRVWTATAFAAVGAWDQKLRAYGLARTVVTAGSVALLFMVLFALGWKFWGGGAVPTQPSPPAEQAKPIIEPFTIQVAAYLKAEDAYKFVDQLKQQGLDAFSTKATSADRTWYQVKVSHFETKALAKQYGQDLKSKGLIDDFYVANYSKPQAAGP